MKISPLRLFLVVMAVGAVAWLTAATPAVTGLIRQANGEVLLTSAATAGTFYRIDTSADLSSGRHRSAAAEFLLSAAGRRARRLHSPRENRKLRAA